MKKLVVVIAAVALAAPMHAQLFVGTAINASGTSNSAFLVDVVADTSQALFGGRAVWGATYDVAGQRVLFTSDGGTVGGADLYQWFEGDPAPTLVGTIMDVTGAPFRIDGLAISNGVLYGSRAAANADGIYQIDMGTLAATLVIAATDSISGIDADPATGIIYGVNDTAQQLVRIDPGAGTITNVVAYPDVNETDIDGLGVGGGMAYLVPDDNSPGLIYVYDLNAGVFGPTLTAPWGATADTFSAGAFIEQPQQQDILAIPTASHAGLALLALLLAAAALPLIRRV